MQLEKEKEKQVRKTDTYMQPSFGVLVIVI